MILQRLKLKSIVKAIIFNQVARQIGQAKIFKQKESGNSEVKKAG